MKLLMVWCNKDANFTYCVCVCVLDVKNLDRDTWTRSVTVIQVK